MWLDLLQLLGPRFLCACETRPVVVTLPEAAEKLPGKGLLLPRLHPLAFLRNQRLGDGGVEGGQALGGGEETLPRPHERAVKRP